MEWGTSMHPFAMWSRKMTIRRIHAAQRAAGPLLLALFSGCNAAAPQAVPELVVRPGAPSLLAVPADCRPLPAVTGNDVGTVVQAGFPGGPGGVWVSETDPRSERISVATRPRWGQPSGRDAPVATLGLPVPEVMLPTTLAGPQLTAPRDDVRQTPQAPQSVAGSELRPIEAPALSLASLNEGRQAEIEAAAASAEATLQHGFRLAERRAHYSAKAEFFKALWLLAQALDGPANDAYTAALSAAVRALEEAEDFVPRAARPDAEIDLPLMISGHRTPALKSALPKTITTRMALDRYLIFAQQKLAEAVDGQAVGSKALYLLGRLHTVAAQDRSPCFVAAEQKALAFQQAAMSADPNNFLAANELGVLLARAGRHEEARTILQHCASLAPRAEVWHNLVVVHRNLGEIALAQQAQQQMTATQAQQRSPKPIGKPSPSDMVRWVEPEEFAKAGPAPAIAPRPAAATPPPQPAPPETSRATRSVGPLGWLPWPGQTR